MVTVDKKRKKRTIAFDDNDEGKMHAGPGMIRDLMRKGVLPPGLGSSDDEVDPCQSPPASQETVGYPEHQPPAPPEATPTMQPATPSVLSGTDAVVPSVAEATANSGDGAELPPLPAAAAAVDRDTVEYVYGFDRLQKYAYRQSAKDAKSPSGTGRGVEFATDIVVKPGRGDYDPCTAVFEDGTEYDLPTLLVIDLRALKFDTDGRVPGEGGGGGGEKVGGGGARTKHVRNDDGDEFFEGAINDVIVVVKFRPQAGRTDLIIIYLKDTTHVAPKFQHRLCLEIRGRITKTIALSIMNTIARSVADGSIPTSNSLRDYMHEEKTRLVEEKTLELEATEGAAAAEATAATETKVAAPVGAEEVAVMSSDGEAEDEEEEDEEEEEAPTSDDDSVNEDEESEEEEPDSD